MDFIEGIGAHWLWITLGLVLGALEMLVPGVYLIWFAAAAIITGALTAVIDISVPLQILNFVAISMIAVFSARRWISESPIESSDPLLNRRGAQMVGQTGTVTQAIENGSGRVHIGDSDWIARGPDIAAGERIRVVGSEGSALMVEPLTKLIADEGAEPAS